jgi:hypothetical protein
MDALTDFLSPIVQGLLTLAIPILVAVAVPWLLGKAKEIKQNMSAEQAAMFEQGVQIAVRAAEQAGISGQIANTGRQKKEYAINAAQNYLNRLGLKVNVDELATLLESEVHKQFTNPQPLVDNPETRSALIDKAIETAVLAAQQGSVQNLIADLTTGLVESKKQYAVDFTAKYLEQHGITLPPELVSGLIDAQIMRIKLQAQRAKQ